MDREKVIKGLDSCSSDICDLDKGCETCPYYEFSGHTEHDFDFNCIRMLTRDSLELLKEQAEEHRRLLSWLGKFCRHIDNGNAWLTDEENIAFFKEKMKQQFGWDTD